MKAFITLALTATSLLSAQVLYVGSYTAKDSKGITAFRFDASAGKLSSLGLMAETDNPSFLALAPSGKVLYAVNESDGPAGGVSAFSIDRATNKLTLLNRVASKGVSPCHIVIDPSGKVALVANYTSGTFASFPIHADGKLGEAATVIQDAGSGPDHARQAGPHSHEMVIEGNLVLGADLGTDHIQLFHLNAANATLTAADPAFAATEPGFGPRHFVISKDKKFIYVLSELKSIVAVMEYDAVRGPGKQLSTVSVTGPDGKPSNAGAEIMLSSNGAFLYTSNRGNSSLSVFSVDQRSGAIRFVQNISSGGRNPRYFTLDPSGKYLLSANQDTNNIVVFRVDPKSGELTPGESVNVGAPVAITFLK